MALRRPRITAHHSSPSVNPPSFPAQGHSPRNPRKRGSSQTTAVDDLSRRRIMHSDLERKRRGDMKEMLVVLESLLPSNAKRKKRRSKCAVLTDTYAYISTLQAQLDALSRKKAQILSAASPRPKCNQTTATGATEAHPAETAPPTQEAVDPPLPKAKAFLLTVEVHSCKSDFLITITTDSGATLLSRALLTLQENDVDVFNACLSRNDCNTLLSVHAQRRAGVAKGITREELRKELEKVAMEEIESGGGEVRRSTMGSSQQQEQE